MTQSRLMLCATLALVFTASIASNGFAQSTNAASEPAQTLAARAKAAALDWQMAAKRRAELRARIERQIAQDEQDAEDKKAELEDEERAKDRIAAFVLKQQDDARQNHAEAARRDWLEGKARRDALRAALDQQSIQNAQSKTAGAETTRAASTTQADTLRAERERAAIDQRRRATAKRAALSKQVKQQLAMETKARLKAAAKARAMALITKRARALAEAQKARAEAEVKTRQAALEQAKAVAMAKVKAAAKARRQAQVQARAKAERDAKAVAQARAKAQARTASQVVIATWGGGYGSAQREALFTPFEKQSGLTTKAITHQGPSAAQLDSAADVINLSSLSAAKGCNSGRLIPLDELTLAPAPGNQPIAADLIDGARIKCGVASMAWSHVLLVRTKAFKRRVPTSIKHVFDVRRYPGKRAFVKSPRYILELALMADGVKPQDVYATLATYEGLSRALTKLEPLRGSIVWIKRASEAYDLLQRGKVAIASGYSGRAFAMVTANPGIKTIWDGQIYDVDYWAVPKTSQNKKAALRFIRYATAPKSLAANARHFPYGPLRRSAVTMTGRHNILDIDLAPYLPTSKKNLRSALKFDASWWALNEEKISTDPWFAKIIGPVSKASSRKSRKAATKTANSKSRRKKRSTQ